MKDCFWQVSVHKKFQRFMSFEWKGVVYSFRALPFGLSLAPYFVTKVFRPVISHLQQLGHQALIYMDDIIVFGKTPKECESAVTATLALLARLGVIVNHKKCALTPSQIMEYLGFVLNTAKMTITAPPYKVRNVTNEIRKFVNRKASTARQAASVLGKIQAMADALFPTRVHTCFLHDWKVSMAAW